MLSRGSLRSGQLLLLPLALMSSFWQHAHGLSQTYCSSQNSGSDYDAVTNIYQSNGACHDECAANYAFAIVQYQQCWCSNYAPADQVDVSQCSQSCPGYPSESCGDKDNGLYGYIKLNIDPSGTLGSGSSSSSTSSAAQSSQQQSTASSVQSDTTVFTSVPVTVTVKQSASVVVSYVTPVCLPKISFCLQPNAALLYSAHLALSSSSKPTTTSSSSTPSSTTSSTPSSTPTSTSFSITSTQGAVVTSSPSSTAADSDTSSLSHTTFVSTRVVTLSGAPVTQTVTSTAVVTPGAGSLHDTERQGVSGGTVAGAVVGSVAGVALLLAGAFFLWRRKRSETSDPESPRSGSGSGSSARRRMERNTSVLSKTGLLSSAGTAADMEKFHDDSTTSHRYHGSESTAPIPTSPDGDRRNSRPLVYDQRLNPAALMQHWEQNGSRASIGTMQDQRDYSRPLGVTNPDIIDD
ncbi:WSC-domain-containing protein [Aureobasidium sp. EXF-10728]|nr:WSC-domain-containing protein [Aureobasidium sp. EXF-10728]